MNRLMTFFNKKKPARALLTTVLMTALATVLPIQKAGAGVTDEGTDIESIKRQLKPELHRDKSFRPDWFRPIAGTLSGYTLALLNYAYTWSMPRPLINRLALYGYAITPESPELFDPEELHSLNKTVTLTQNSASPNYETDRPDSALIEHYLRTLTPSSSFNPLTPDDITPDTLKKKVDEITAWLKSEQAQPVRDMLIKKNNDAIEEQLNKFSERYRDENKPALPLLLDGVPVVIKDEINVAGYSTTFGLLPQNFISPSTGNSPTNQAATTDSDVVSHLRESGAIILGKSNQHIFGLGATGLNPQYPQLANPFNSRYVPGGSSSGSAVAVQTGIVPLAIGTDGGGSVSIPAAISGVQALKPTLNKISTANYDSAEKNLVAIGLLGKDFATIARGYMATARKYPTEEISQQQKTLTIGIDSRWFQHASQEVAETTLSCVQTLMDSLKTRLIAEQVTLLAMTYLPENHEKQLWNTHMVLFAKGEATSQARYINTPNIPAETNMALGMGAALTEANENNANSNRRILKEHFNKNIFSRADIIVMPTTLTTAPKIGAYRQNGELDLSKAYLLSSHTSLANLTGSPRVSILCGFDKDNLPIGLQLMGPDNSELLLIQVAATLEQALKNEIENSEAWQQRIHFTPAQ